MAFSYCHVYYILVHPKSFFLLLALTDGESDSRANMKEQQMNRDCHTVLEDGSMIRTVEKC